MTLSRTVSLSPSGSESGFIDGSVVYGSDAERAAALRVADGSGKLKSSPGDLLPLNNPTYFPNGLLENDNAGLADPTTLFVAGDVRAPENVALVSLQTVFLREHNRLAEQIAGANPALTGDEIYDRARRVVSAQLQHITYQEFLPVLLGSGAIGPYAGYDENINPGLTNMFSTVAFRFGHSTINPEIPRIDDAGAEIAAGHLSLRHATFNSQPIIDDGIEPILRGLSEQLAQNVDTLVIDELRNLLFGPPGSGGLDLASINIQRGRDHGLPDYNQARVDIGLPSVTTFADITSDTDLQASLASIYSNVDDIDVWVGGLAEDHAPGAMVGELFQTVMKDQFQRLRSGDRFWYENEQFTNTELADIRGTTLADIIQRNTAIGNLPASVFSTVVPAAGPTAVGGPAASQITEYASPDGTGNNMANLNWASAGENLLRVSTVDYEDGISSPAGADRVGPREISNALFSQSGSVPNVIGATSLMTFWGQFLAHDIDFSPSGTSDQLKIHGEQIPGDFTYPFVAEDTELLLGHTFYEDTNNHIARPIYLPAIDMANATQIDPMVDTMVTTAAIPGTELFIAAGTVQDQQGNMFDGQLSITEVPVNLTPAALPDNLFPDMVVTIQPAGTVFTTPAPLTFPNTAGYPAGMTMDLWSINPESGEFEIVGKSQVSDDGFYVESLEGGIRTSSWHFVVPPKPTLSNPKTNVSNQNQTCKTCQATVNSNSEVELHSGALLETHDLVTYQSLGVTRGFRLQYDSQRADPRPIIHFGANNWSSGFLVARLSFSNGNVSTRVSGFAGGLGLRGGEHFWLPPSGTSSVDVALQGNLTALPSGIYKYRVTRGLMQFEESFAGTMSAFSGEIVHVNAIDSPFGAGWELAEVQQIVENADGTLLLIEGTGASLVFKPIVAQPGQYESPVGHFSTLVKNGNDTYTHTMTDQAVYEYNTDGWLVSMTDRNGNQTQHVYDGDRLITIIDPVGLETTFTYTAERVTSITDPAGRVTVMVYDGAGNLTSITDPDDASRTFEYDTRHHLVAEADQLGSHEETRYGFHGRVIGSTRKDGTTQSFSPLQTRGLRRASQTNDPDKALPAPSAKSKAMAFTVDPRGNVTTNILDQFGQTVSSFDALGSLPAVQRDAANLVTVQTDGRGFVTGFTYDERGNLTSVTDDVNRGGSLFPGQKLSTGTSPVFATTGDFNGDGVTDLATANEYSDDVSVLLGVGDGMFLPEQRFATGDGPTSVTTGDFNGDGVTDLATANRFSDDVSVMLGVGDGMFLPEQRFAAGDGPTSVTTGDFNGDGVTDLATANEYSDDVSVLLGVGDGMFLPERRFAAGRGPSSVTTGDFNRDGVTDLVTANGFFFSNDVSVLLGVGDGTFLPERRFATGGGPSSVTTGDFNGDGVTDLVTANERNFSNDVSVLLGVGDGTFLPEQRFATGGGPASVTTGDFNGDGVTDLATANRFSDDVSVLLGVGDGTFQPEQRVATGGGPASVTTGDFNGDGATDLVTANRFSDDVSVLLGDGAGVFPSPVTDEDPLVRNRAAVSVTTGDFNGDGIADLATANVGPSDVSVLLGNGDGTFDRPQHIPVRGGPQSIIMGDFNGDGVTDLATAAGDLAVLLGNGDGTFDRPQRFPVRGGPQSIIMGDFNGDGVTDLATANAAGDLSVLLGVGDGSFLPEQRFATGSGPSSVTAGDFNGDGVTDLVTSNRNYGSNDVSVLLGVGDGTFLPEQRFATGRGPSSVTTGDFNGDGVTDLVTSNSYYGSNDVSVLLGVGDGTFLPEQRFATGDGPTSVTTGDFNGDGLTDLTTSNNGGYFGSGDVSVLLGVGDGTFLPEQRFATGGAPSAVTTGDFNGDGVTDLATASRSPGDVTVLLGVGDGTLADGQSYFLGDDISSSVATGDFNGDRVTDLASTNQGSGDVSLRLGVGDGTFLPEQRFATGNKPSSVTTGDFNGDGVTDLVTANEYSGDVSVLLGVGDGTFLPEQRFATGGGPTSVTTGDFNGDGVTDLVTSNSYYGSNDVSVLLGVGDGTFLPEQRFATGRGPSSVTTGDFNGDGLTDLVTTNGYYSSNDVSVLLGVGDGTFLPEQRFATGRAPSSVTTGDFNGDGVTDLTTSNEGYGSNDVSVLLGVGDGTFTPEQRFATGRGPSSVTTGDFNGDGVIDLATTNYGFGSNDVSVLLGVGDGTFDTSARFTAGSSPLFSATGDFNSDGLTDLAIANFSSQGFLVLLGTGQAGIGAGVQPRTFTYDPVYSQPTHITDDLGRITLFEIDSANGNRLATTQVVGQLDSPTNGEMDDVVTSVTYTSQGLIDVVTDPLGRVTDFDYDGFGRVQRITAAVGTSDEAFQLFEYDAAGNRTAVIDENGNRTQFEYDPLNRLTQSTEADPDGAGPLTSPITTFGYDDRGNLIETTNASGQRSTSSYDPLDRLILTRDALAGETTLNYNPNGNVIATTDPNGNQTNLTYDSRDRLTSSTDPDGGVTTFRYDVDNNLVFLADPNGNTTRFGYDARSRMVREEDPLGAETRYSYDAADNRTAMTDRNGRVTESQYDELDRMVSETWLNNDGTLANTVDYTYDKSSNLLSISDDVSALSFAFDSRDRVLSVDNAGTLDASGLPNVILNYSYDDVGNVLSVAESIGGSAGATTTYEYDALNRNTSIEQSGPGVSEKAIDLVYNQIGQFDSIDRYSDLARTNLVAESDYEYDDLDRLLSLEHGSDIDPRSIAFYDFEHDPASRITALTDIDGRTDYVYDDRDQLVGADRDAADTRGNEGYTYDANGNRIDSHLHGSGYITGPGNRLLSDGTFDYEYDDEGNLTLRTEIATGDYRTFDFDHRNRLIRVTDYSSGGIITQEIVTTYDALDRRIAKTVDSNGEAAGGEITKHLVYDGDNVLLDFVDADGSGMVESPILAARYLFGPGVDQVLAQEIVANGQTLWLLSDHLGTVHDIVDNTGAVLNHIQYDSFGNILHQTNSLITTRYLFTGREYEFELGLYYYRARFYDSSTGQFIGEDLLGSATGASNLYQYVDNDPLNNIDPYGLDAVEINYGHSSLIVDTPNGLVQIDFGPVTSTGILTGRSHVFIRPVTVANLPPGRVLRTRSLTLKQGQQIIDRAKQMRTDAMSGKYIYSPLDLLDPRNYYGNRLARNCMGAIADLLEGFPSSTPNSVLNGRTPGGP